MGPGWWPDPRCCRCPCRRRRSTRCPRPGRRLTARAHGRKNSATRSATEKRRDLGDEEVDERLLHVAELVGDAEAGDALALQVGTKLLGQLDAGGPLHDEDEIGPL